MSWTSSSYSFIRGSRWDKNNSFELLVHIFIRLSSPSNIGQIFHSFIISLLDITSLLGYEQVSNYWFKKIYNRWRFISIIVFQYSLTTHLSASYWSNWNINNTSKNAYMRNIRFINQKRNCKLGDDMHMITCWLDTNQCLAMQDFIFPSTNLNHLIL